MARSGFNSVLKIAIKEDPSFVVWVTHGAATGDEEPTTNLCVRGIACTVDITAATMVHVTVLKFADSQLRVVATRLFDVQCTDTVRSVTERSFGVAGVEIVVEGPWTLTDQSKAVCGEQHTRARKVDPILDKILSTFTHVSGRARRYVQSSFLEADWSIDKTLQPMPSLSGWPAAGNLRFDRALYWRRMLLAALSLCKMTLGALLANRATASRADRAVLNDALIGFMLQSMAGWYPTKGESVDDRKLGSLSCSLNRDCDDQAIEIVAVCHQMMATNTIHYVDSTDPISQLATELYYHLMKGFHPAVAVVCEANGSTVDPTTGTQPKADGGHVFAMLPRRTPLGENPWGTTDSTAPFAADTTLADALVLEGTRFTVPTISSKWQRTCWNQFFDTPPSIPDASGLAFLKALNPLQYKLCVSAHTATTTYLFVNAAGGLGASLTDVLTGAAKLRNATQHILAQQCNASAAWEYSPICRRFNHRPNLDEMESIIARSPALLRMLDIKQLVPFDATCCEWNYVFAPFASYVASHADTPGFQRVRVLCTSPLVNFVFWDLCLVLDATSGRLNV